MGRFVFTRLAWLLPTILLILVGTFFLDRAFPDDRIAQQLLLEGSDIVLSRENYMNAYEDLAHKEGKLLPPFYLSVLPDYMPRDIHKIYPKDKRKSVISIIHDSRQGTLVLSLFQSINEAIIKSTGNPSLLRSLLALEQSRTVAQLKNGIDNLKLSHPDNTDVDAVYQAARQLSRSSAFIYPIIYWNGCANSFHHWFKDGLSPSGRISLTDGRPVWQKISNAMAWTFSMSIISLIFIGILSLVLAYFMARYQGSNWDQVTNAILYSLYAMPLFWLCTLMVVFFTTSEYGSWTDIFPSVGIKPSFGERTFLRRLAENAGQLILPILCIVVHAMAYITRQTRADIISQTEKPYLLSARARGINESGLIRRHALPNSLLTYTTLMTGALPRLFTGSVVVEVIFNIPGVGKLLLESIRSADWPVTLHVLVIVGILTALGYLLGDVILAKLFPKTMTSLATS